ncbi:response regulator [Candidatus Woesearchaeota archaeon]|nr:response regulator [Candidatus Woesearchaeota archaeon]
MVQLKVLIVEDSEDDALLLGRELRQGGFEVVSERVDTAKAMAAALKKQEWDIIISDYIMPNFSGLDALKALRASGIDIPFIIVSGQIGEETAVEAMKAGANDYVMKGRLARLLPAVKRELEEASSRREHRKAEADLARHREHIEELYHNSNDGYLSVDINNRVVEANKAFLEMSGCSRQEVVSSDVERFFDSGKEIYALFGRKELVRNIEVGLRKKNGEVVPSKVNVLAIFADGQYIGSSMNITDLSNVRKLEREKAILAREVIRLTGKIPLTGNEKLVFYSRVRYPLLNDIELSRKLKLKRSTITAIRNRLEREHFYSTYRIPDFSLLGCELLTITYATLNPLYADEASKLKLFEEASGAPEQLCVEATSNQFIEACVSKSLTDVKMHLDAMAAKFEAGGLSRALRSVYFPFGLSSFLKLFDYGSYLRSLLELEAVEEPKAPQKAALKPAVRKLTPNEKAILYALVKYPSANDSGLAKITRLPRPSISQARLKLIKGGFLRIVNIPNFMKVGSELIVFSHIRLEPGASPESVARIKAHIEGCPHCCIAAVSSTDLCALSAYVDYTDYETERNGHIRFYSDQRMRTVATSICPLPDTKFMKLQFAPLLKKLFELKVRF